MQAITTKYLGATNYRCSRIVASAQAGRIIVPWDHALDVEANHNAAAIALCDKYGWTGRLIGGGLPSGKGNAYVMEPRCRHCDRNRPLHACSAVAGDKKAKKR
jgi:hypothetical protein